MTSAFGQAWGAGSGTWNAGLKAGKMAKATKGWGIRGVLAENGSPGFDSRPGGSTENFSGQDFRRSNFLPLERTF